MTPSTQIARSATAADLRGYALALLLCIVGGAIAWVLDAPSSCFLLALVAASLYGGRGPGYLVIIGSAAIFEFFFLPPRLHWLHSEASLLRWTVFVGVMLLTQAILHAKRRSDLGRLAIVEEFRSLAETSPDGILSTNDAGQLLFANPALLRMFGKSEGQLLGSSIEELLPGFERHSGEYMARRNDGSTFYVEATCGMFGSKTTIFLRDISDRKEAEDSLRRTQAKLANAAQKAAVSELAAAIVHEISQPLSAMVANGQACLRWLASTPPNTVDGRASVERIVRDGKDAAEIVRGLRSVFRRSAPEKVELDLRVIVTEVVSLMRPRAQREGIFLETDISPGVPAIQGDKIQLQQVLINLVSNAMDALRDLHNQKPHILIRVREKGTDILTEVVDNGPKAPEFDTIFDAFMTTKATGMGMGLAICRSIVNAHYGQLWGEARAEGGTVFAFTLPVKVEAHASSH
jgi:PAS domain S-box-containing protein